MTKEIENIKNEFQTFFALSMRSSAKWQMYACVCLCTTIRLNQITKDFWRFSQCRDRGMREQIGIQNQMTVSFATKNGLLPFETINVYRHLHVNIKSKMSIPNRTDMQGTWVYSTFACIRFGMLQQELASWFVVISTLVVCISCTSI